MEPSFDLSNFIESLASVEPTPGGGSAAALAGALGAALAAMVARLTVGRKRYAEVEPQMQAVLDQAEALRARLTQLVSDDAAAYEQVRAAYRLPKETAEEQAVREAAIQDAFKAASLTPLDTVDACLEVMHLAEKAATLGNVNATSDGAVGMLLAHAGLQGAALNVRTNLGGIQDEEFVANGKAAIAAALVEANLLSQLVMQSVEERIQ